MRIAHRIVSYLMIALGTIHIAMTPVFFNVFEQRTMWFVAQGVMGILLGFMNLIYLTIEQRKQAVEAIVSIANVLVLTFSILYILVDTTFPSFVAALLVLLLLSFNIKQIVEHCHSGRSS